MDDFIFGNGVAPDLDFEERENARAPRNSTIKWVFGLIKKLEFGTACWLKNRTRGGRSCQIKGCAISSMCARFGGWWEGNF